MRVLNRLVHSFVTSQPPFPSIWCVPCAQVAGELPTRFKYREVPTVDCGLTAEDILMLSDSELNKLASIRNFATYVR